MTDLAAWASRAESVARELHNQGIDIELKIARKGFDAEGNLGMELSVGLTPPAVIAILEMLAVYQAGKAKAERDLKLQSIVAGMESHEA